MHELGIARNILEIVQQSVPSDEEPAVRRIRIKVGQMSGVVPDSLEFCLNALLNDTKMDRADLVIEKIPTVSLCRECGHRFSVDDFVFSCRACSSPNVEVVSGNELEVVDIELADD